MFEHIALPPDFAMFSPHHEGVILEVDINRSKLFRPCFVFGIVFVYELAGPRAPFGVPDPTVSPLKKRLSINDRAYPAGSRS